MTHHQPVLLAEVLDLIGPTAGGRYLDGTLGDGGHCAGLLERSAPDGQVLGLDRDPAALVRARARLEPWIERCELCCAPASSMEAVIAARGWSGVDGVVLDLGLSSPQLDDPERGFSFLRDGPLDMRFDRRQPLTAEEILNQGAEAEIASILFRFGEERRARQVARAVVAARPLRGTLQLASVVERALGGRRGRTTHPATRTFQALRIAVNDELGEVEAAVGAALRALVPGGRAAVISFHSLEDRIVKNIFAASTGRGIERDPYGNPVREPSFRRITRHAVKGEDRDPNPRARSARLRAVQRLPDAHGSPRSVPPAPRRSR